MEEKNDVIEVATEVVEETVNSVKKSKLAEAKELIENSKNLVSKAELEVEECKIGVSEAAKEFESAKEEFQNSSFNECEGLLQKVGFEYDSYDEDEPFELSLDRDDDDIFSVQNISTGRFTGLILALLAGLVTLLGWIYLATKQLAIDPSTITPDTAATHVNPVLNWIGSLIPNGNMTFGALILGFSVLIVAWIVYALRVGSKGRKNLRVAEETYEKSAEYCNSKEQCKKEMQKVDSHLKKATDEISNLKAVLDEQLSSLKRVVHVEGTYEDEKEYHPTSKKTMRETEKVMRGAEILLNTAITKEGRLNETSVHALNNARAIYADYLARIYD